MTASLRLALARGRPLWTAMRPYVPTLTLAFICLVMLAGAGVHSAYAVTPVPTSTPVTLSIPTNTIFSSTNDWIASFAPIAAIGIGISIALAVLGYLGHAIVQAFRN